MLATCLFAGCSAGADVDEVDDLPARQVARPEPIVLDEVRGRHRSIAIGDRRSEVIARHGMSLLPPRSDDTGPIGSDEAGTPGNWRPPGPDGRFIRYSRDVAYRQSAYLVESRLKEPRVYGFIVTDPRAQTLNGVGVGDTLAFAVERYPQMRCDVVGPANEAVRPQFPACRARIAPRRFLGFGENPIRSITLMTVPFDCPREPHPRGSC